jgi:hypothetical protein
VIGIPRADLHSPGSVLSRFDANAAAIAAATEVGGSAASTSMWESCWYNGNRAASSASISARSGKSVSRGRAVGSRSIRANSTSTGACKNATNNPGRTSARRTSGVVTAPPPRATTR